MYILTWFREVFWLTTARLSSPLSASPTRGLCRLPWGGAPGGQYPPPPGPHRVTSNPQQNQTQNDGTK